MSTLWYGWEFNTQCVALKCTDLICSCKFYTNIRSQVHRSFKNWEISESWSGIAPMLGGPLWSLCLWFFIFASLRVVSNSQCCLCHSFSNEFCFQICLPLLTQIWQNPQQHQQRHIIHHHKQRQHLQYHKQRQDPQQHEQQQNPQHH